VVKSSCLIIYFFEIFIEEVQHLRICFYLVLFLDKPMPLIREEQILISETFLLHGRNNLLSLRLFHARIVCPLHDEERRLDLLGGEKRRLAFETLRILGLRNVLLAILLESTLAALALQHAARADPQRIAKLLAELEHAAGRRDARFVCALALARRGRLILEVEGECRGLISDAPRGAHGFGYDPVFFFPQLGRTYAELSEEEKNRVSHRACAVAALLELLAGSADLG